MISAESPRIAADAHFFLLEHHLSLNAAMSYDEFEVLALEISKVFDRVRRSAI